MTTKKTQLIDVVIGRLEQDKENLKARFASVHEGIVTAPTPTQSHSDQTRFQLSQVANEIDRSFAVKDEGTRVLKSLLTELGDEAFTTRVSQEVLVGSLVDVRDSSGSDERYFILPAGGGIEIPDGDQCAIVVTPTAPIAKALMNRTVGDEVIAHFSKQVRTLKVTAIY